MAVSLLSPPASRPPTPSAAPSPILEESAVLSTQLDTLLEQYLQLLDQYTVLREQLSAQFSEGFMSLANAQRTSNLGPGRRYGQEGYDSRMKARVRWTVTATNNSSSATNSDHKAEEHEKSGNCQGAYTFTTTTFEQLKGLSNDIPTGRADKELMDRQSGAKVPGDEAKVEENVKASFRDPVTWYGILVPSSLRQTQNHFSVMLQSVLPDLVTVKSKMEALEQHIWSLRSNMGINDSYDSMLKSKTRSTTNLLADIDNMLARSKLHIGE